MIIAMPESRAETTTEICFESFGVRVALSADRPDDFERLKAVLPPGWSPCPPEAVEHRFELVTGANGAHGATDGGIALISDSTLEMAMMMLDTHLKARIAVHAVDRTFVHAGVVGYEDQAIVIPGKSFSGKTTLVAELVRAGATYYSDEYAVIDHDGLVHPYAKPLSLRDERAEQHDHDVATLGGIAGEEPLVVGTVVITNYWPDARWNPQRVSTGRGALALVENSVPARLRPEDAMRTAVRAVQAAVVLEGDRGEAAETAQSLLQSVRS